MRMPDHDGKSSSALCLPTPIACVSKNIGSRNTLYIKRDDLLPFCFGGNKARKAQYFFREIDAGGYDCVVTYGSSSSNHCRIVANLAASRGIPCYIIGPQEASNPTFNSKLMELFGAELTIVPIEEVHDTIEATLESLRCKGANPYFIPGGGHGNLGTQAYVDCYREIKEQEEKNNIFFDYIFLASGTGTTQAGLICGKLLHKDSRKIIGISVARKIPYGRNVVLECIQDYLKQAGIHVNQNSIEAATIFNDQYVGAGYGAANPKIEETIRSCLLRYGIPLDHTYTGKAFYGMLEYIRLNQLEKMNILFIHTGGTPLFFDELMKMNLLGRD